MNKCNMHRASDKISIYFTLEYQLQQILILECKVLENLHIVLCLREF